MTTNSPVLQKHRDPLGRYYTRPLVGDTLVRDLSFKKSPNLVLDLGVGEGALSRAASKRWKNATIYGVDIDSNLDSQNREMGRKLRFVSADALSIRLPHMLGIDKMDVDAAVCNPPYIIPKWKPCYAQLLDEAGLSKSTPATQDIPAAILFIAQNIRLLKDNGEAVIIVPDGIVNSERLADFRHLLSETVWVKKAIKLPRNSFHRTEAQAHAIFIKKTPPGNRTTALQEMSEEGALSDSIFIDKKHSHITLDYRRASMLDTYRDQHIVRIRDTGANVFRGNIERQNALAHKIFALHTTDIPCSNTLSKIRISHDFKEKSEASKLRVAEPGDILITRVGRNMNKKVALVQNGSAPITDCIIAIRAEESLRNQIINALEIGSPSSPLSFLCHGVAAKFLTVNDILGIQLCQKKK